MAEGDETAVVEHHVAASPEAVFALLSDEEGWLRWQGVAAELDVRPGGGLWIDVLGDGNAARGEFREVIPGRRLVFTWGWEAPGHPVPPGSSLVEIDLEPAGDGTLIRLRHTVSAPGWGERVGGAWEHYASRLALAAAGADPGADPLRAEPTRES